ncbi:MAG: type II toxin-antitoxin system VapC family toxin [Bacteroidetes bacterium]|nr:type II toxin-antitoxin system VapC family toxin [Bacteroidota bacterium]
MNYLIDTNALSELTKIKGDTKVIQWFNETPNYELFLSVLTIAEIRKGIEKLKDSSKKDVLTTWLQTELDERFKNRILSFGISEAMIWGKLTARMENKGIKLPIIDSMIAAIALSKNAILVTRNTKDFEATGVKLLNPWLE